MFRILIILLLCFWVVRSFSFPVLEGEGISKVGGEKSNSLGRDQSIQLVIPSQEEKALREQMKSFMPQPMMERERARKKWSPWSGAYFNWSTQRWDRTREGGARLESYNFLSATYRLSSSSSISLRPTFILSGAGRNGFNGYYESPEFRMGDTYFQYINWNLALLPWNVGLIGKFRFYLPTSESSSRRRLVTSLRSWMQFYKPLNRGYELTFHVRPEVYLYSQRGVMNRFHSGALANKQGRLESSLELAKKVSTNWGLAASAGVNYNFYYDVPSFGIKRRTQETYKFSYTAFMDLGGVWLNLGFLNNVVTRGSNRRGGDRSFRLFRDDEMKFSVMTYIRI